MGGERSSTIRTREGGKICAICGVLLPPPHTPGEKRCAKCTGRHRVYMYFFERKGWYCQFLEADCKTPLPKTGPPAFGSRSTTCRSVPYPQRSPLPILEKIVYTKLFTPLCDQFHLPFSQRYCYPPRPSRLYWGDTGAVGAPSLIDLPLPFVLDISVVNLRGQGRFLHFLSAWVCVLTGLVYVPSGLITRHFWKQVFPSKSSDAAQEHWW
jgi:hypothetical protein